MFIVNYVLYWTGVVVWCIISVIVLFLLYIAFCTIWNRELKPVLSNLRLIFFGLPRSEKRSYYQIWSDMYPWHYRYYTRGQGKGKLNRCVLRKIIFRARQEDLKKQRDGQ